MKKYLTLFSGILLFANLLNAAPSNVANIVLDKKTQKDLKEISNLIEEKVANINNIFANERVKNMCKEWPTCEEWVKNKTSKDQKFQVIDTEVERWIKQWKINKVGNKKEPTWVYHFYVQTMEDGATKTYLFKGKENGTSYSAPVLVRKFPEHPILTEPTQSITHPESSINNPKEFCASWPGCKQWKHFNDIFGVISTQHIYKYDEQQNALWERRLYVLIETRTSSDIYYFKAYQKEVGGNYTYEAPVESKSLLPKDEKALIIPPLEFNSEL